MVQEVQSYLNTIFLGRHSLLWDGCSCPASTTAPLQLGRTRAMHGATQRANFAKKVHKPPLRINVINSELDGFNASMPVLQTPKSCDAVIEDKIRYV